MHYSFGLNTPQKDLFFFFPCHFCKPSINLEFTFLDSFLIATNPNFLLTFCCMFTVFFNICLFFFLTIPPHPPPRPSQFHHINIVRILYLNSFILLARFPFSVFSSGLSQIFKHSYYSRSL